MSRIALPMWMREVVQELVEKQLALARMLQARMVATDDTSHTRMRSKVRATEILSAVRALDALSRDLSTMVGGVRALAENAECMQHTMAFAAFCERELEREEHARKAERTAQRARSRVAP